MDLTRLGHAAVLVEVGRTRILVDPGVYSDTWHALTDLDAVLVTHQHPDHVDAVNLVHTMAANSGARLLVEPDVVPLLAEHDLDAEAVTPGAVVGVGDLSVEVVGGRHALIHDQIPRIGNVGFVVSAGAHGPRFFHPGDAYDTVPERIDVLALPLTAPWATAGATADFLGTVGPSQAFPIHDATLSALGETAYLRIVGALTGNSGQLVPVEAGGSLSL